MALGGGRGIVGVPGDVVRRLARRESRRMRCHHRASVPWSPPAGLTRVGGFFGKGFPGALVAICAGALWR